MPTNPTSLRIVAAYAAAITAILGLSVNACAASPTAGRSYLERPPQDEVIYFVLPDRFENADPSNDRGGLAGGPLEHGFDPTHKGFYHGGDLKGLTQRLDYIEGLGATAIWLGPIYKNKPVQGAPGEESAGYHGYWITDFTKVDPHFGTETDLKEFVDAAHARNMKVYLDIITNHTADVIAYRECHDPEYKQIGETADGCPYRNKAAFPYGAKGGAAGDPINEGFMGDRPPFQTTANFSKLTRPDFAYTPFVRPSEADVKKPAWLNEPIYYHNRGDTHWEGESETYGDFSGLDDLMTEHPKVVSGMIDIFKQWITDYRIDGFRIDTAKHVNPEFWRQFAPAVIDHAKSLGIPNFYVFGEAYHPDAPELLARHTRVDGFPTVLDFAFQSTVQKVVAEGAPAIRFAELFAVDDLYEGGAAGAGLAPVFIGNHDMGRFATFVRLASPDLTDEQRLARVRLAHAMMFFLRGAPVIYYGDEQGFDGDGNDQAAREDMFPSAVGTYNDNDLLGSDATTAASNFDRGHPLYEAIADMAEAYHGDAALRRGRQIIRAAKRDGALLAVSRLSDAHGERLVVFNPSDEPLDTDIEIDARSSEWRAIRGACPARSTSPGSVRVRLAPWAYAICASNPWKAAQ